MDILDLMMGGSVAEKEPNKKETTDTVKLSEKVTIKPISPEDMPVYEFEMGMDESNKNEEEQSKTKDIIKSGEKAEENDNTIYDEPKLVCDSGINRFKDMVSELNTEMNEYPEKSKEKIKEAESKVKKIKEQLDDSEFIAKSSDSIILMKKKDLQKAEESIQKLKEEYNLYFSDTNFGMKRMMYLQMQGAILAHLEEKSKDQSYDEKMRLEHKDFVHLMKYLFEEVKKKTFAEKASTFSFGHESSNKLPGGGHNSEGVVAMLKDDVVYAIIDQYLDCDDFESIMTERRKAAKKRKGNKPKEKKPAKKAAKASVSNNISIFDLMR